MNTFYKKITINGTDIYNKDYKDLIEGSLISSDGYNQKIVIPEGITKIADNLFADNYYLGSVSLPQSIESIGSRAFYYCPLTSIILPTNIKTIGESAFYDHAAAVIRIPASVTTIGYGAFSPSYNNTCTIFFCEAPSKPDGWTEDWAGYNDECPIIWDCNNNNIADDGNIYVEQAGVVYKIEESSASVVCCERSQKTIVIADTIMVGDTTYPVINFSENFSLSYNNTVEILSIGNNITTINASIFSHCEALTSVTIGESVESIGSNAFEYCTLLENLEFSNGLKSISSSAFTGCNSLKIIEIPSSVTSIGTNAFRLCASLTDIFVDDNNTNYCSIDGVLYDKDVTTLIQYPMGKMNPAFEVPNSVTSISSNAFDRCKSITSLTLPESITSMGSNAFYDCKALSHVNYLGTLEQWCNIEFASSANPLSYGATLSIQGELITNLVIPDTVTTLKSYAFYGGAFNSIVIGDSVTTIGRSAFDSCAVTKTLTLGKNVKTLNSYVFYGCTGLEELNYKATALNALSSNNYVFSDAGFKSAGITLNIANNVQSIPSYLFNPQSTITGYTNIVNINFEEGCICSTIGNYTFKCPHLLKLILPASIKNLGTKAFDCEKLVEIYNLTTLPITLGENTCGFVGYYAKVLHTALTEPSILEVVDDYMFMTFDNTHYLMRYMKTPVELTLPNSYKGNTYEIYSHAFYAVKSLTSVNVPSMVTKIGAQAFYYCQNLGTFTIAEGLVSIGYYAFRDCWLKSIVIPNSVTTIENMAFWNCSSLKTIHIGTGITEIGKEAFNGSSKIFYIAAETPPSIQTSTFGTNGSCATAFYVPTEAAVNAYKSATNWSSFSTKIKQGVVEL